MKAPFIIICLIETVMGCASGAGIEVAGNLYCSAVSQLQYTNVGAAGSYNEVTYMGIDGTCLTSPKSFSGPLSPLDEEVCSFAVLAAHLKAYQTRSPFTFVVLLL